MNHEHNIEMIEEVKHEAETAEKDHKFRLLPIQYEELAEECERDEDLESLFRDMMDHCLSYTKSLIEFQRAALKRGGTEEIGENERISFGELDKTRKIVHDSTIDSINILARELQKKGRNSKWVGNIAGNRAAYGRFAVLMSYARILIDPNLNM